MKVVICKNYEEISKKASAIVAGVITLKEDAVLGLATGSSPLGLYQELIKKCENREISFRNVVTYNLDEYYPIKPDNPQSYRYFMNENLFDHIDIDKAHTFVPDGSAEDIDEACENYERMLEMIGGADVQVLGIGRNGHIAFNEPEAYFTAKTHQANLKESTIQANARFFENEDEVPRKAITMGIGSIMRAKRIILIANGKNKAQAIHDTVCGPITPQCPASVLQLHQNVTTFADEEAASLLPKA